MSRFHEKEQKYLRSLGDEESIKIGSGAVIHSATKSISHSGDVTFFTSCGADHATNQSRLNFRVVKEDVTCKRCIRRG